MNLEEFGYEFGVSGAENLVYKLNQIEKETEELDEAVAHLGNTFQQFFDVALRSTIPPAFIKMVMDEARAFSKQAEFIDRLAQSSGISAKQIQQFGYALHKFGGDVSTATMQLDHLQSKLEEMQKPIAKGGGMASELANVSKKYGISLQGVNNTFDLLKSIAVRMESLSDRRKVNLARALGLDESTFLLVKKGLKEVEEELLKAQKYILFDEKDIETAKLFESTLKEIGADLTLISKSFSFGAIPEMQKFANLMKSVTNFMSEHKEVVKGIGMTAFGAGLYGIFRIINLLPTKFLKASAGVMSLGLAIGTISEEIDKLDRGNKKNTLIGTLDSKGYKKAAKYIEALYRAILDLSKNKSFDKFKDFFKMIGEDLGVSANPQIQKFIQLLDAIISRFKNLKDLGNAYKKDGSSGILASLITGKDTNNKDYLNKSKEIKDQGGAFSYIKNNAIKTYNEYVKKFLPPIIDTINSMIDSLKLGFLDLIIWIKQKLGMELNQTEKTRVIQKSIIEKANNAVNKQIQDQQSKITSVILDDKKTFSEKSNEIQKLAFSLAENIKKNNANTEYSELGIATKLLFGSTKNAINLKRERNKEEEAQKQDEEIKAIQAIDLLAFYNKYQAEKRKKGVSGNKIGMDLSTLVGTEIQGIDLNKDFLNDFITKAELHFPINDNKDGKSTFGSIFGSLIDGLKEKANNILAPYTTKMLDRIEVTNPESAILKQLQEDPKALLTGKIKPIDILIEAIVSELHDIYENFVNADLFLRELPELTKKLTTFFERINKILSAIEIIFENGLSIILGKIGVKLGASIGKFFGPAGSVVGGVIGGGLGIATGAIIQKKAFMTPTEERQLNQESKKAIDVLQDEKSLIKDKTKAIGTITLNASKTLSLDMIKEAMKGKPESKKSYNEKLNDIQNMMSAYPEFDDDLALMYQDTLNESRAQGIQAGYNNIKALSNSITPLNSNVRNDNSVTVNQSIVINGGSNLTPEQVKQAAKNGTNDALNGLKNAAYNISGGNTN